MSGNPCVGCESFTLCGWKGNKENFACMKHPERVPQKEIQMSYSYPGIHKTTVKKKKKPNRNKKQKPKKKKTKTH